jgi:CysZ protein
VLDALIRAFRQLAEPATRRLLWRCALLAITTFAGLIALVSTALTVLDPTGLTWLNTMLALAGSLAALLLAWLLFPAVFALTLGLFAEDVVDAIEREHYPDLPRPTGMGLGETLRTTLRFVAIAVVLNLLALPLYLIPGTNLLVYLALNGYLLGREYFELVAGRRLPAASVAGLRRRIRVRLWLAGAIIAAMLVVPGFNLVAPVVAIAFMVHLFEALRRSGDLAGYGLGTSARRELGERFDLRATEVFDFTR